MDMLTRRFAFTVGVVLLALCVPAHTQDKVKVVASFSILADLVKNVGGERVEVDTLVGANGNAHVFSPSPADARRLADAKVVFVNGLGFEGWLDRLVKASGSKAPIVVASKGIKPRERHGDQGHGHDHGRADPHAWQSVANVKIYVANIRDALTVTDPAGTAVYNANAGAYLGKLEALEQELKTAIAKIPADRRRIITSHDSFGYFQAAYGIEFIAPQGVSTETEASARDVATIIKLIRAKKIAGVFLENVTDPRLLKQIAAETGAKLGGTLYSDALTDAKGGAPSYVDLIRHNLRELAAALAN
jgi:zinc/manganese transport system substrate-binding protein